MSSDLKLEAESRLDHGSRSSRRLRRDDKIPAVVYGQGSEPLSVTLDRPKFRATLNAAGPNAVITLDVDGSDYLTIVKNMQRDPIANRVTHVDFMLIDIDQRLIVDVPIALVGDAVLVRQEGAVVQQQMMTLTVEAPAGNIPQVFEVDISEMSIDNSTVKKVAKLARIKIEKSEEENLKVELNNILDWVDKLQKVDTGNTEPMLSVFNESMPMRDDKPKSNYSNENILSNAPNKKTGFFVVPKVVE